MNREKARMETGTETRRTDTNRINTQGRADRLLESLSQNRIERQGRQDRKNIRTTGKETRENMRQQTREDDKTAARQNRYSRGLSSRF